MRRPRIQQHESNIFLLPAVPANEAVSTAPNEPHASYFGVRVSVRFMASCMGTYFIDLQPAVAMLVLRVQRRDGVSSKSATEAGPDGSSTTASADS